MVVEARDYGDLDWGGDDINGKIQDILWRWS